MSKRNIVVATLFALNIFGACTTLEDQKSTLVSPHNADFVWEIDTNELIPYNAQGRYADRLVHCIYPKETGRNCSFNNMPLLHHNNPNPEVEDIMNRLVISKNHPWIADNFRMFLEAQPDYILELFSSVTAVVIADKIRPSYHDSRTGAIYINPRKFIWLSTEQKDSLTHRLDHRAANGKDLNFAYKRDYEINEAYWLKEDEDLIPDNRFHNFFLKLSKVLFHELAHARNEYYAATFDDIDMDKSPHENSDNFLKNGKTIAKRLEKESALRSPIWTAALDTINYGDEATFALENANVLHMMEEFQNDVAIYPYVYTQSKYELINGDPIEVYNEDPAILFESLMMEYYYEARLNVYFKDLSDSECEDQWVQKLTNRLAIPEVFARAQFVAQEMLPQYHFSIEGVGQPTPPESLCDVAITE